MATSPLIACSMLYVLPSKTLVSRAFPASSIVDLPVALSIGPNLTGISPVCNNVSANCILVPISDIYRVGVRG